MRTIVLKARSSIEIPYDVTFLEQDGRLRVTCTCNAGIMHTLCKHRIELIAGDTSRLHAKPTDAVWQSIVALVEAYGLNNLMKELQSAQAAMEEAKVRVKSLREHVGEGLDHGVPSKTHEKR